MSDATIKSFRSKKGNEVIFRYPVKTDFADMYSFACDIGSEDTYVALDAPPSEQEEHDFFDRMLREVESRESIYIMAYVNGSFAGNGRVNRGKGRHHHVGGLGISLTRQYRDEGIGTELMRLLIDEAKSHGLRLLTLTCFETNAPALRVYEKLGFKRSGIIPGAISYKGDYIGEVQFYLPL